MIDDQRKLPPGWRWVRLGEVCEINHPHPSIKRSDDVPTTFVPMEKVDAVSGTTTGQRLRPFGEIKKSYTCFAVEDKS